MSSPRAPHDSTSRAVLPTIQAYERSARDFLARWGRGRYRRPLFLTQWLTRLSPRARLLDLGCGGGQDAKYLSERGYRVVGLDRTVALLSFARTRAPRLPLILADICRLPLRRDSLDGIWAAASLIHLPKSELRGTLAELLCMIRSSGTLAATFTHGRKSRISKRGWIPGRYFARYRKEELRRIFHHAGWRVVGLTVVTDQERKGRWINVIAVKSSSLP